MSRTLALTAVLSFAAILLPAADEKPPADLALVPHDTFAFATMRLGDLSADGGFKKLVAALAGLGADGVRHLAEFEAIFGIAPADVERVTVAARRLSTGPAFILRTVRPVGRDALARKLGKTRAAKIGGKAVLVAERGLEAVGAPNAFWLVDDRTIVAAEADALAPYLEALAAGGKAHPLADGLKAAAGTHSFVLAGRPELIFRVMDAELKADAPPETKKAGDGEKEGTAEEKDEKRPFKLRTLAEILDDKEGRHSRLDLLPFVPLARGRRFVVTADAGKGGLTVNGRLDFASADDARDGETVLAMGLLLLREGLPMFLRDEAGVDVTAPAFAGLIKQMRAATRAVAFKVDGNDLTMKTKMSFDLTPLVAFVAETAPIRADANNLKQIALSFHIYESTFGQMPPRAVCDKDGKPLLSWRVLILPYIEQTPLYNQFKLDEPWDSPHNKKLIARMPAIFKAPKRAAAGPGETFYQVFAGPKTLFPTPTTKPRISAILDGTANTFLVAEAGTAVPWTKPDDIVITDKMVPKLGGQFEKFLNVAFCDGSVRRVSRKAPEKSLRVYIDPADGIVPPNDIDP